MLPGHLQQGIRAGARGPHVLIAADKSDSPMARSRRCRAAARTPSRIELGPAHTHDARHQCSIRPSTTGQCRSQLCDCFHAGS